MTESLTGVPEVLKSVGVGVAFLLLFAPGFVSLKVYDFLMPAEPRKVADHVYEIIGYSCVTYAVLAPFAAPKLLEPPSVLLHDLGMLQRLSALTFLVVPAVIGAGSAVLVQGKDRLGTGYVLTTKLAWDWVFGKIGPAGVIVTLTSGERVVGSFSRGAIATTYPFDQQVYIDRLWQVNEQDVFIAPIPGSKGQLIMGNTISTIRFVELPKDAT